MTVSAETRPRLRLLLVEDDENDADLVRFELERGGFDLHCERVDNEPSLARALEHEWDVIISDFAMPGFSGLRAFDLYRSRGSQTPFIFVSGALGEDRAVEAMRAGARDYFLKGNLARLSVAVRRELAESANRRERQRAEARALRERRRLALAIEASNQGVFELGPEEESADGARQNTLQYTGPWGAIMGLETAELPRALEAASTWWFERVHLEDRAALRAGAAAFLAGRVDRFTGELRLAHADGRHVHVAVFARATQHRPDGSVSQAVGVVHDLSARRQLEEQLRQAQKMEAVGQLAGGVAHDFNNLLTAIISFATFALEQQPTASSAASDIEEILKAANLAQSLTKQLLAFSRRTTVNPRVLNVNDVVTSTERMLRRLLGADIELTTALAADLAAVKIDPDALEQVLLNMAVNARDAMARGGQLTIATRNARLEAADTLASGGDSPPGAYVVVSVADQGTGIDPSTLDRIFEPFFTTKEAGRGTGLGLSTCYGIVKQAGGFITVESRLGAGTTFHVHLPQVDSPSDTARGGVARQDLRGSEVVLVVEDNPAVLKLTARILTRLGYGVLQAENGRAALDLAANPDTRIDLLLSDLIMPVLGGRALVEEVRKIRPGLPVLLVSGYSPSTVQEGGAGLEDVPLLQKPFTPDSLGRKVREVLDAAGARQAS
ncbi:MAG TPA: response regulator [Polyangia bacterium]